MPQAMTNGEPKRRRAILTVGDLPTLFTVLDGQQELLVSEFATFHRSTRDGWRFD
jgi:hypothetical protein